MFFFFPLHFVNIRPTLLHGDTVILPWKNAKNLVDSGEAHLI